MTPQARRALHRLAARAHDRAALADRTYNTDESFVATLLRQEHAVEDACDRTDNAYSATYDTLRDLPAPTHAELWEMDQTRCANDEADLGNHEMAAAFHRLAALCTLTEQQRAARKLRTLA